MPYLDTSVLTAYYCREARSQHVQGLLSDIEQAVISPLDEVEFYCAVARLVRSGALERPAALRLFAEFRRHLDEPRYSVLPVEPKGVHLQSRRKPYCHPRGGKLPL